MLSNRKIIQKIYDGYGKLQIEIHPVADQVFRKLANLIYSQRSFQIRNLSDTGRAFIQISKNLLFVVRTEPITPKKLQNLLLRVKSLYQKLNKDEHIILKEIYNQLLELFEIETHPFLNYISKIAHENENILFVHYNENYSKTVRSELKSLYSHKSIHKGEKYKYEVFYDKIIFFGKPEWYRDMISFPPCEKVFCILFDWDFSNFKFKKIFTDIPSLSGNIPRIQDTSDKLAHSEVIDKNKFSNIIDETIDRELIKSKLYQSDIYLEGDKKISSVLLTLLEDEFAVLIPNTKNYELSVLKKETYQDDYNIHQLSPKELRNGMWYIERGFSSDDIKKKLSKKHFGEEYTRSVNHQIRWKELLSAKINRTSLNYVVKEIESYGAVSATDYNVRNWASNDVIRPSSDQDFKAILKLVNMLDEFEKIATSAEIIKKCHKKVGFQITELLINEIKIELEKGEIDLRQINEPIEVNIEKEDETKMTLYPITSVHDFGDVERSLTHHVFRYL